MINNQIDDEEQKDLVEEYSKFLSLDKVLEIGTGYGRLSKFFTNYTGIDKNKNHIIKSNGIRILSNGNSLPFKDKLFDLVFSCTALMLNKNVISIVNEMARCSKRYVMFIELKKNTKWAYGHDYQRFMETNRFELYDFKTLRTSPRSKPLGLWLFRRKGSRY